MAFWLASPLMDSPALMITAGALGWEFAIAKVIAALGVGLLGGFSMRALQSMSCFAAPLRNQPATSCCGSPRSDSVSVHWHVWKDPTRWKLFCSELMSNGLFLFKLMSLAYVFESLMIAYIPAQTVAAWVGGEGVAPIALAALVGAPAYLNGYAAPALVSGLMTQGMSAGAAMSFMVAGGISSIPAMMAVFALVRLPVFATYVALGLIGAVLSGLLFSIY
jgi:uncharacterized membrane protein YraQ (UPF0718 family)